jgi:hypothetical protein
MKASLIPRLSPSRWSALAFLLSLLFAAGGAVLGDGLACTGCGNCQIFSACELARSQCLVLYWFQVKASCAFNVDGAQVT